MRREKDKDKKTEAFPTLRLHKSNLGPRDLSVPLHPHYKGKEDGLAAWVGFGPRSSRAQGSSDEQEAEEHSDEDLGQGQIFVGGPTLPVEVAR